MKGISREDYKVIEKYLIAFEDNGGFVEVKKENGYYYIFDEVSQIYIADTIEEVRGWLYGVVQSKNKVV